MVRVEQYGIFELEAKGRGAVSPGAVFSNGAQRYEVPAFVNGEGRYVVRFMPTQPGVWRYEAAEGSMTANGEFMCVEAAEGNHGPVVARGMGFGYADGIKYIPFGTTCYAWVHQPQALRGQTLETLRRAPFNKLRMCVFPKSMPYNNNEPALFPFHKTADGGWDIQKPDERYWQMLEGCIAGLGRMGIEVDLILFHPYDRWGFAKLMREESLAYLDYCIARLAAYRNIWWSLANEYDLVLAKTNEDWDAIGEYVQSKDVYGHLLSIHNCFGIYPKRPWMTHCSIQHSDVRHVPLWAQEYALPIVVDECGYEGTLEFGWGNLSAFEMVNRTWDTVCRGGFCTHGETFHREDEILWWAKGGRLHGESPARIQFLRDLLYGLPGDLAYIPGRMGSLNPNEAAGAPQEMQENPFYRALMNVDEAALTQVKLKNMPATIGNGECRLQYFGRICPALCSYDLPEEGSYRVELIDVWTMERAVLMESAHGKTKVKLPGREGQAVLITRKAGPAL